MGVALIALGANVAADGRTPARALHEAVGRIARGGFAIRAVSRFFRTPCFPPGAGPDYVNGAVAVEVPHTDGPAAQALLDRLHRIEAEFGRKRETRWGARTLDLDLLGLDDLVAPDAGTFAHWHGLSPDLQARAAPDRLVVPHPRIQDRAFVLVPLADIAPHWRHPVLQLTTLDMLGRIGPGEIGEIAPVG